jgi:hypothetical protein
MFLTHGCSVVKCWAENRGFNSVDRATATATDMDADTEQILSSESDKPSCVISTESSSVLHTDAATGTRSGAGAGSTL